MVTLTCKNPAMSFLLLIVESKTTSTIAQRSKSTFRGKACNSILEKINFWRGLMVWIIYKKRIFVRCKSLNLSLEFSLYCISCQTYSIPRPPSYTSYEPMSAELEIDSDKKGIISLSFISPHNIEGDSKDSFETTHVYLGTCTASFSNQLIAVITSKWLAIFSFQLLKTETLLFLPMDVPGFLSLACWCFSFSVKILMSSHPLCSGTSAWLRLHRC